MHYLVIKTPLKILILNLLNFYTDIEDCSRPVNMTPRFTACDALSRVEGGQKKELSFPEKDLAEHQRSLGEFGVGFW